MGGVQVTLLVELALITWRGFVSERGATAQQKAAIAKGYANAANVPAQRLPLPADYLAAVIVWGGLAVLASYSPASRVAVLVGLGLNVATALSMPGLPSSVADLFPGGVVPKQAAQPQGATP